MLNSTGEYALRAAVHLAQHVGDPQTSAMVAEHTRVPQGYLSKILQQMVKAELITSQRGINGGFVLGRPPGRITVLDVLKAVDAQPHRIHKCPLGLPGHLRLCPVHRLVDEAVETVEKAFKSADLESLSKSVRGITPLCEAS
ncbi:MAG: Rrf2 family transcriptional regulator [Candidatus Sumerlaeota bacterium]